MCICHHIDKYYYFLNSLTMGEIFPSLLNNSYVQQQIKLPTPLAESIRTYQKDNHCVTDDRYPPTGHKSLMNSAG